MGMISDVRGNRYFIQEDGICVGIFGCQVRELVAFYQAKDWC